MRISKMVLLTAMMMVVGATALFAQAEQLSDTGSITIGGNVPERVEITVTPVTGYDDLDLRADTTGSGVSVASVNELSNSSDGYTVTLESTNATAAQAFFASDSTVDTLDYSITYGGDTVNFTSGISTVTDTTATGGKTGDTLDGIDRDVKIYYDGSDANLFSGDYADTLTFVITAG